MVHHTKDSSTKLLSFQPLLKRYKKKKKKGNIQRVCWAVLRNHTDLTKKQTAARVLPPARLLTLHRSSSTCHAQNVTMPLMLRPIAYSGATIAKNECRR